jgi:hypothetical protein
LSAFSARNVTLENAQLAQSLFNQMDYLQLTNEFSFQFMIYMWCTVGDIDRAFRLYRQLSLRNLSTTFETARMIILTALKQQVTYIDIEDLFLSICSRRECLLRCRALLQEMVDMGGYDLSFKSFKKYLFYLSQADVRGSAEAAVSLFKVIERSNLTRQIDLECFEFLFRTFEKSLSLSHADNARNALRYMASLQVIPSLAVYESLLKTWVNSRRPDSPRVCEEIVRSLREQDISMSQTSTYNILLKAWSRSLLPSAGSKAIEVLEMMNKDNIIPDGETYALVGYCISKSKSRSLLLFFK